MWLETSDPSTRAVLFDLDGTLVDPCGGITEGIAYALKSMSIAVPTESVLQSMIGPKLAYSLLNKTEVTPEQLPEVVERYQQWYREEGMMRSQLYPGVAGLITELNAAGVPVAVATQKPQSMAQVLLEHHGLLPQLDYLSGAADDESTVDDADDTTQPPKAAIIAEAVDGLSHAGKLQDPADGSAPQAVMIGDRIHDALGAQANGIPFIAVSWGFAGPDEFSDDTWQADTPEQLRRYIQQALGLQQVPAPQVPAPGEEAS